MRLKSVGVSCVAALSAFHLSGCQPGGNGGEEARTLSAAEAKARVQRFVHEQRLGKANVQLVPPDHDWSFLAAPKEPSSSSDEQAPGEALVAEATVAYRVLPAGMRACLRAGDYAVLVPVAEACPGDWLAYRGDSRSTGTSTFRLNWTGNPAIVGSASLGVQQPVEPLRIFAHDDPQLGERLYVNNGTALEAFDAGGKRVWRTPALGIGEIIDVTDLDGDGTAEVVFSPGSRWNMANPSGAGPGELIVLDARRGEVLWRFAFTGIEFGLNRRRTTIVSNAQGPGKSIYAVMTYSPHVWRFDFAAGARSGELRWKSEPLVYDSPDKAPIVADFDRDGTPEVVVDSLGTLYALRLSDGAILHSLQYGPFHSFGGFLAPVDVDGDGAPEVVGLSNTIYMKDAFAVRYAASGLSLIWRKEWESGLETTSFELYAMRGVVRPEGSARAFLVWSARDLRDPHGRHALEVVDAATGALVDRMDGVTFLELLRAASGEYRIAATRNDSSIELIALGSTGLGTVARVAAQRWHGVVRQGTPSYLDDTARAASAALIRDAAGRDSLLVASAGGAAYAQPLVGETALLPGPMVAFDAVAGFLATDDAGRIRRLRPDMAPAALAPYAPKVFGAPITADLDGDGRREVIVPYRRGSGIARFSEQGSARIELAVDASPDQQRESFHVPLITQAGPRSERIVVAYETGAALRLVALDARATRLWSWSLPASNWEPSLVIGNNADGAQTIFYNDSRMTAGFDPSTGALLWTMGTLGQCQRQIASIDWNADGIADAAIQSADMIAVLDGATGLPLARHHAQTAYGGYVAASGQPGPSGPLPSIAVHAVGGLTLVNSRDGMTFDQQLDPRLVESIPPVIGRVGRGNEEGLFQISGAGRLRAMTLSGSLVGEVALDVPALAMTGAYVDADDVVDLLVSTYRGEVIAVSGAALQTLWRVQLDGPAGPAVATDVDGDGVGEIVVITGDGRIRVLAPAA
jgi:outer membrane protein assembly factor BamB